MQIYVWDETRKKSLSGFIFTKNFALRSNAPLVNKKYHFVSPSKLSSTTQVHTNQKVYQIFMLYSFLKRVHGPSMGQGPMEVRK